MKPETMELCMGVVNGVSMSVISINHHPLHALFFPQETPFLFIPSLPSDPPPPFPANSNISNRHHSLARRSGIIVTRPENPIPE
ncbi:hypothetical protein ACFX12_043234 [Malus domestica]